MGFDFDIMSMCPPLAEFTNLEQIKSFTLFEDTSEGRWVGYWTSRNLIAVK